MKYLVYISAASHLMNEDELLSILQISRHNNMKRKLTGMLLYSEGSFIQLLEGNEADLIETYRSIEKDSRHKNIIKMIEGESDERHFPEWAMGFKSASASEMEEFNGYVNPSYNKELLADNSKAVINLLKVFADINRM